MKKISETDLNILDKIEDKELLEKLKDLLRDTEDEVEQNISTDLSEQKKFIDFILERYELFKKYNILLYGNHIKDFENGNKFYSEGQEGFPREAIYLGKFLKDRLKNSENEFKNILEIGVGTMAYIANTIAKSLPNSKIEGTEIHKPTYDTLIKYNSKLNLNTSFYLTGNFPDTETKYDMVVSNPPQMPMPNGGENYDDGGKDGLDTIEELIKNSLKRKSERGVTIFLNAFDFLGTEHLYGRKRSIISLVKQYGGKIINIQSEKRYVRKGGITEQNIDYIEKEIAPRFNFKKDEKGIYHKMDFVEIKFD